MTRRKLTELGVGFVSLTEALELIVPTGRAMAGMLAVFAEFEREVLREWALAGIAGPAGGSALWPSADGRAHGRRGHPAQGQRVSHSEIARRLRIGRSTVRRILAVG